MHYETAERVHPTALLYFVIVHRYEWGYRPRQHLKFLIDYSIVNYSKCDLALASQAQSAGRGA